MNNQLLGNFVKVEQFEGRKGAVKNQFIIQTDISFFEKPKRKPKRK